MNITQEIYNKSVDQIVLEDCHVETVECEICEQHFPKSSCSKCYACGSYKCQEHSGYQCCDGRDM